MLKPVITTVCLLGLGAAAHAGPTLRLLGNPTGPLVLPYSLSGDGRVVGGFYIAMEGTTAGVWSPSTGPVPAPGPLLSHQSGEQAGVSVISSDGRIVMIQSGPEGGTASAWYADGTVAELGNLGGMLPSGLPMTGSMSVSSGGYSTGWSISPRGLEAFVWSRSKGMVGLGDLQQNPAAYDTGSYATWISEDGDRVRGIARAAETRSDLFEWTPAEGMVVLADSSAFGEVISVIDAADDGTAMVGLYRPLDEDIERAFLWTEAHGFEQLPNLPNGSRFLPLAVSGDGGVVLSGNDRIWVRGSGFLSLRALAELRGVESLHLSFNGLAISTDGNTIVGCAFGVLPDGYAQFGFIYTFDNPCPADLNGDGRVDFFDLADFLRTFTAGDLFADENLDGRLDFFDIQGYLGVLAAGCP